MRRTLPILLLTLLFVASCAAQTFKAFHTFSFTDGSSPNGDLIRDSAGNFYGTTQFGGSSNRGIVFKLDSKGNETILYTFTGGTDGGIPIGRVIRDRAATCTGSHHWAAIRPAVAELYSN